MRFASASDYVRIQLTATPLAGLLRHQPEPPGQPLAEVLTADVAAALQAGPDSQAAWRFRRRLTFSSRTGKPSTRPERVPAALPQQACRGPNAGRQLDRNDRRMPGSPIPARSPDLPALDRRTNQNGGYSRVCCAAGRTSALGRCLGARPSAHRPNRQLGTDLRGSSSHAARRTAVWPMALPGRPDWGAALRSFRPCSPRPVPSRDRFAAGGP